MKLVAVAAIAFLASAAAPEKSKLDLTAFFTGKTHAENVMKIVFKRPVKLVVDSVGGRGDRGDFVLIDTVHEGDKPARTRKWVMKPDGPNHFTGALSDATGPVDVVVSGDTATVRYTMKGNLKVTQVMRLKDSRTLANNVVVKKFGLKFASVNGTIRKLD